MARAAFFLLVLLAAAGCGAKSKPVFNDPTYDADQALNTLRAALDAWQQGKAATLGRMQPPIRFGDEDFKSGAKLVKYELAEPDVPIRPYADVKVMLTLRDRKGNTIDRLATYQVTLKPGLAVLRSDS